MGFRKPPMRLAIWPVFAEEAPPPLKAEAKLSRSLCCVAREGSFKEARTASKRLIVIGELI
jgi:hypothetical protein